MYLHIFIMHGDFFVMSYSGKEYQGAGGSEWKMRKEKNPLLLVDLPEYVIQNYMINDDLSVRQQARRALEKALPRYFDKKGNFTRLTVSFPFRMYEVDDKKGKG